MKEDRIINALGQVKDEFILEAAPKAGREKHHAFRGLAAALAIVLLGALFFSDCPRRRSGGICGGKGQLPDRDPVPAEGDHHHGRGCAG